jgi:hypothetical protein
VQDFKVKVEESFESTGSAMQLGGSKKTIDFDKLGERRIIMASDETWSIWEKVFKKHESGALYDIDAACAFNEIMSKGGDSKFKFTPLNQNQIKNL